MSTGPGARGRRQPGQHHAGEAHPQPGRSRRRPRAAGPAPRGADPGRVRPRPGAARPADAGHGRLRGARRSSAGRRPAPTCPSSSSPPTTRTAASSGHSTAAPTTSCAKPFDATELVLRVRTLLLNRFAYQELRRSRALLRARLDLFEPDLAGIDRDPAARARTSSAARSTRAASRSPCSRWSTCATGRWSGSRRSPGSPSDVLSGAGAWFAAALEVGLATELELAALRKALALLPGRPAGTSLSVNASPATVLGGLVDVLPDVAWDTGGARADRARAGRRLRGAQRGARAAARGRGAGRRRRRRVRLREPAAHPRPAPRRHQDRHRHHPRRRHRPQPRRDRRHAGAASPRRWGSTSWPRGSRRRPSVDRLLELGVVLGQGDLLGRPVVPADPTRPTPGRSPRAVTVRGMPVRSPPRSPRAPVP